MLCQRSTRAAARLRPLPSSNQVMPRHVESGTLAKCRPFQLTMSRSSPASISATTVACSASRPRTASPISTSSARPAPGKSTLLERHGAARPGARQRLRAHRPHGDLVERVAARIPRLTREDAIYLNASDPRSRTDTIPCGKCARSSSRSPPPGMLEVLKKMWPDAWGVRMEHILRNILHGAPGAAGRHAARRAADHDRQEIPERGRQIAPERNRARISWKRNTSASRSATAPTASRRSRTRSAPSSPTPCSIAFLPSPNRTCTSARSWTRARCSGEPRQRPAGRGQLVAAWRACW